MSFYSSPARDTEGETRHCIIRMVGVGAAAPTKVLGLGVTITYTGAGVYVLTWSENPGRWAGVSVGLQATTPANIAGHTVVLGAFNTTAFTVTVNFFGATEVAHDLVALEWINLDIVFKLSL